MTANVSLMNNPKNETKVLAYIGSYPNALTNPEITEELFTEERNSIFKAMQMSYGEHGAITPETIEQYYKGSQADLMNAPVVQVIEPLISDLQRLLKKRKLYDIAQYALTAANQDNPNLLEVQEMLLGVEETTTDPTLTVASMKFMKTLRAKRSKTYHFISTGIPILDVAMGGEWPRGNVSLIVADPGGSKTSLVCNSSLRMAFKDNASLFLSLEMGKQELISRWAADFCSIDNADIISGNLTEDQEHEIQTAINLFDTLPMYVVDKDGLSILDMVPIIRSHVRDKGVKVVFIDHLQRIKTGENRNVELGLIAKILRSLAKKLDIHVCIISQKNSKDGVWSVRDSGNVPADVDIILNISLEDGTDVRSATFEFTKFRNGRTGKYPTLFNGPFLRYGKAVQENE